jgi:hypothetical protein
MFFRLESYGKVKNAEVGALVRGDFFTRRLEEIEKAKCCGKF